MIVLDTNVVSELMAVDCDLTVRDWVDRQERSELYLTAVNLAELLYGIARLPDGRRKNGMTVVLNELRKRIVGEVLPFDEAASIAFADLMSRTRAKGFVVGEPDGQIASIAVVHGFTVATRDVGPFQAAGVPVINPWES